MKKVIILIEIIIIILLLYITLFRLEAKEPKYFILEATGYYPGPECTYPFDDGFTAIGDVAGRGSVAIDDKNGPLRMGQRVWIEGYGLGKCNDRGSAIKGWKIDLCFETLEEAREWGRKLTKVYLLGGEIMEIIGKEYKKKLVNSKVEVTHFVKVKCSMKTDITKFIWGKRKCFICGGKFKDGDKPVACITKKGMNKIICEKCYLGLPEDEK